MKGVGTRDGGKPTPKEIPYEQPQGPKDQMNQGPGYGDRPDGQNLGTNGTQGRH